MNKMITRQTDVSMKENTKNTHIQFRLKREKKEEIKYLSNLCNTNMSQFIMESIDKNISSLTST